MYDTIYDMAEVPALPAKFQSRGGAQDALVSSLVQVSQGGSTVSLTAPKSRSNKVSSIGMGGCGERVIW